ncbi:nucleotidyltransferase family protein [Neisseriaceae bacterium ESL0693]|nr:nucleotidyltransferase family protein [Neisseriaceae bacterium ESL0693]
MKTMILAAGRGERLRPLTDECPKPLLKVGDLPLIGHHLKRLHQAGLNDIVINHAWLGQHIETELGDGQHYGVHIQYSPECEGGLETAGGIAMALPLLGQQPFLVVNGDVLTDFDFQCVFERAKAMQQRNDLAHLWLVENPEHHQEGDFGLTQEGRLSANPVASQSWTFSGIGIYSPALFQSIAPNTRARLAPLLRQAMTSDRISAERYNGHWLDVGTIDRLQKARQWVKNGLCQG